jgi:hypothetical protein
MEKVQKLHPLQWLKKAKKIGVKNVQFERFAECHTAALNSGLCPLK